MRSKGIAFRQVALLALCLNSGYINGDKYIVSRYEKNYE